MAKELNEDTGFNVSIKSLAGIGFIMATIMLIVLGLMATEKLHLLKFISTYN